MRITYYEEHVVLTPESQAEAMQIDTLYRNMNKEKPTYSYELRNVPHALILHLVFRSTGDY